MKKRRRGEGQGPDDAVIRAQTERDILLWRKKLLQEERFVYDRLNQRPRPSDAVLAGELTSAFGRSFTPADVKRIRGTLFTKLQEAGIL